MIDPELLGLLRCPEDTSTLTLADDALLSRLNAAILRGAVTNLGGEKVTAPLASGLVRADGSRLYPLTDGVPVMLIRQAISLESDATG